jgi:MFS family permease
VRQPSAASIPKPTGYFLGLSRDTVLLAFSSLFADISTEMLYPVLPVFLTQVLKASGSDIGLIEGIAQATQNMAQGFSGWLSDLLQRRKPIALAGYALAAISKPFMGLAASWPTFLVARFTDRLGTGTRSAPRDALVASSVASQYRGRAFGLEGLGDNLGAFLGPLVAVLLLSTLHFRMRSLFYLAIIPGLLAVAMVFFVHESSTPATKESATTESATKKSATKVSRNSRGLHRYPRAYWKFLLVIATFGIGNSSNSFLILHTRDLGASLTSTILIYAAFNLVAALASYPAGALSDKLGRKNLLLLAFVTFLLTYLGFARVHSLLVIGVLFALYGIFQGIFRAVGKVFATDLVPDDLRASGIGWYSTAVGLSQLIASLIAGQLWDNVSHTAVFLYGSVTAVLGILSLLLLVQSGNPQPFPSTSASYNK